MALRIEAQLHGDGSSFFAMMGRAELASKRLGGIMLGPLKTAIAGAFTVGAASGLARSTINMASHFRDLADQLGVNVEWLQAFSVAAKNAGSSGDDLAALLMQLNRARARAAGGNAIAMAGFGQLGFTSDEVKNAPLQQFAEKLFKTFENGQNQSLLPIMQQLGIRASRQLASAFSEGLISGAETARAAGAVMAEDVVDQLDAFQDKWETLKATLIVQVAPAVLTVTQALVAFWNMLKVGVAFIKGLRPGGGTALKDAEAQIWKSAGEFGAISQMAQSRRARRRRTEGAGPGFIPPIPIDVPQERLTGSSYSDSLTGVGNFLGGGLANNLAALGQETNKLLKQQKAVLEQIRDHISELSGLDLGVPAS